MFIRAQQHRFLLKRFVAGDQLTLGLPLRVTWSEWGSRPFRPAMRRKLTLLHATIEAYFNSACSKNSRSETGILL